MDKFLLSENPMIDAAKRRIYIFHTQKPAMLIEVLHEQFVSGTEKHFLTGNYENIKGEIETISFIVAGLLICDSEITEEMSVKIDKVLKKAWHWYVSYLKMEDQINQDFE